MGTILRCRCLYCGYRPRRFFEGCGMGGCNVLMMCAACRRIHSHWIAVRDLSKPPILQCPASPTHQVQEWPPTKPCPRCGEPMTSEKAGTWD